MSHPAGGPLDRASTPAPAGILAAPGPPSGTFDAVADRYDARFTHHPVGRAVRAAVWRHLDTAFGPGARVADLGCGTGADAVHLARRGADVTAIDASPAMLAVARRNAAAAGVGDRVRLVQARIEDLASTDLVGAALDGAIADFGSLNCLSALSVRRLGRDLGHCLRRGGTFVAVVMGPACAWETVWHLAHRDPRRAFRRWRAGGAAADLGGGPFVVRYPSARALARLLTPELRLVRVAAVGCVLPPVYAGDWLAGRPRAVAWLAALDRRVERRWLAVALADHYLAWLELRP